MTARQFIPLAIDGLAKDVLGRRFAWKGIHGWKRLPARDVVRFPQTRMPDPYGDGLIPCRRI